MNVENLSSTTTNVIRRHCTISVILIPYT